MFCCLTKRISSSYLSSYLYLYLISLSTSFSSSRILNHKFTLLLFWFSWQSRYPSVSHCQEIDFQLPATPKPSISFTAPLSLRVICGSTKTHHLVRKGRQGSKITRMASTENLFINNVHRALVIFILYIYKIYFFVVLHCVHTLECKSIIILKHSET